MKKILVIVALLIGFAVAGLAMFLITFDADRYRPLVIRQLEGALGKPVKLDRLSLAWDHGIAIQLRGFALYEGPGALQPLTEVESISALLRLMPLLHRQVEIDALHVKGGVVTWVTGTPLLAAVRMTSLDVVVKRIGLALGAPMEFELNAALGADMPNMRATGRVTLPGAGTGGSADAVHLAIERLRLERVLPPPRAAEPRLHGVLSARLEGAAATLEPAQVMRAVSGSGTIALDEPVIKNLNILREVFQRLSMLPGLEERLEARLPEEYRAKLAAPDTVLAPCHLVARIESGRLRIDEFQVQSDTFGISGSGWIDLNGALEARTMLRVDPTLSEAIIRSVNELNGLANAKGELEMPVIVQGTTSQWAVMPDLRYVASRVLVTKAAELLGTLLAKPQSESEKPGEPENGPQREPTPRDLLNTLLRATRKPDASR